MQTAVGILTFTLTGKNHAQLNYDLKKKKKKKNSGSGLSTIINMLGPIFIHIAGYSRDQKAPKIHIDNSFCLCLALCLS